MFPDIEELRRLLRYDPTTGVLYWRVRTSQRTPVGSVAGRTARGRYCTISIDYRRYQAHRLVWAIVHGEHPPDIIDHIDGDPSNNRIENLRAATHQQNTWNSRVRRTSRSGLKGVSLCRRSGKWRADIRNAGKIQCLGFFNTPVEAAEKYKQVALERRGEFARW